MKETLQPFHFQKPERPKKEDFQGSHFVNGTDESIEIATTDSFAYNKTSFQKALSEWKRLYGDKPEPEWKSYNDEEPEIENESICLVKGKEDSWIFERGGDWDEDYWYRSDGVEECLPCKCTHWADKATYDTRLAEWNYHQVRYPGFKEQENLLYKGNPDSRVFIRFDGKATTIWGPGFHCDFEKGLSFSLFDMIIKENGIEL